MYDINPALLERLRSELQDAKIVFRNMTTGNEFTVTEKSVVSLSVNRSSSNTDGIVVGSAIASELTLTLNNFYNDFTTKQFENCEMYVYIGVHDTLIINAGDRLLLSTGDCLSVSSGIPLGVFVVDEVRKSGTSINIVALDRMIMLDQLADLTELTFQCTVGQMLEYICTKTGLVNGTDMQSLFNASYTVIIAPSESDLTYRQLIMMIAEITATCAFMDWSGKLVLKWYTNTGVAINKSDRFSSNIAENPLTITGVRITDGETQYVGGTEDYMIEISSNTLIQHDEQSLATALFNRLNGITWIPFTAEIFSSPHLYPLDIVTIQSIDKSGVSYPTYVTDITFTLNRNTAIQGKGETVSYKRAVLTPMTKSERTTVDILNAKIKEADDHAGRAEDAAEAAEEYVDTQLLSYSTTSEMNSAINTSASNILSTVSGSYSTKAELQAQVDQLQAQIDNDIQQFTTQDVPTLNNYPASGWTPAQYPNHVGDVATISNPQSAEDGHSYRFTYNDQTGVYSWVLISNSDVTKALVDSAEALSKVDGVIEDLTLNYYDSTEVDSAINQSATDITSTVSQTYETKTDANVKLNTAKTYADGVASTAQGNAEDYVDGKLLSYSTTLQMESAINQTAQSIEQSVSSTYTTKTEFYDLEIGGMNLIKCSDTYDYPDYGFIN